MFFILSELKSLPHLSSKAWHSSWWLVWIECMCIFFIPALLISPVVFLPFWSSRFGPYWASSQLPCPDSSALEIAHPGSWEPTVCMYSQLHILFFWLITLVTSMDCSRKIAKCYNQSCFSSELVVKYLPVCHCLQMTEVEFTSWGSPLHLDCGLGYATYFGQFSISQCDASIFL